MSADIQMITEAMAQQTRLLREIANDLRTLVRHAELANPALAEPAHNRTDSPIRPASIAVDPALFPRGSGR